MKVPKKATTATTNGTASGGMTISCDRSSLQEPRPVRFEPDQIALEIVELHHPGRTLTSAIPRNSTACSNGRHSAARKPDIDLAVDKIPFGTSAQSHQHRIERRFLFRRELKPGQEVEGFAMIARLVELVRDSRSIIGSDGRCDQRSSCVMAHHSADFRVGISAARVEQGTPATACWTKTPPRSLAR